MSNNRVTRRQFLTYTITGVGGFMAASMLMPMARFAIDPILQTKEDGDFVQTSQKVADIKAYDSIGVMADLDNTVVLMAANASLSGGGSASVGATTITTVLQNNVQALVGSGSDLFARTLKKDGGIRTRNRDKKERGVIVHAAGDETAVMLGIAAAGL